ncbi:DivIVA domain-containing protein [Niameybacter massiliensis]|uniref:DivIVA domain-containing protein n=1 Tax=Holtiella tumoricola TaxID=3018743 RepID=A0AA42DNW6_9FIRM|nr:MULTISPECIES: DivIVA domain-containing protein [Lachnospirales]MDA3732564.1 DivIVA domain-containing protein [Holtiella tumoricola]
MLSPVDIQNKEFKKAKMGGYNIAEVNEFLDEVLEGYQQLTKENYELKDKLNMLNENIQYYRTMEATIQNALVLAEKTAQDTKTLAYEKADQIKKEAEQKAESTLEQAKQDIYALSNKREELKKQFLAMKVQIKQMLQAQLEILEQQNITMMTDEISSPIKYERTADEEAAATSEDDDTFFTKEFTLLSDEA